MQYIGNDLVAFSELKFFNRPGYKEKAFTPAEICMEQVHNCDCYYGVLWSCKESAYKAFVKSGFRKSFASGMYEVKLQSEKKENSFTGTVNYKNSIFYTKSEIIKDKYIHTLASNSPEGLETALHDVKYIPENSYEFQNTAAIGLLKEHLVKYFQIKISDIDIHYDHLQKYPMVYFDSGKKHIDVSLSHDGNFVSYGIIITDKTDKTFQ